MKKLVAAVLTGVLVAGTLSTGVYAKDDDKTITVAASATPHAEILEEAKPLQVVFTMSHSESIPEQKTAWMIWKTEIPSQYQMIPQTKQEHFFFSRITESSH